MLAIYIVMAIVGGGLIAASALGGLGSHASIDHPGTADLHADNSLDHHADHSADGQSVLHESGFWLPFFSLRFWTYFFGAGGLAGLILSLTKASYEPMTVLIAGGFGLLMGCLAAYTVRLLSKHETNTAATEDDFVGALGKMTVGARDSQPGKVRASIRGDIIDMIAVSDSGKDLLQGEEVLIIGLEGNTARVASKTDYLD